MATISARRRPIRDGAARSNERNCRIFSGSFRAGVPMVRQQKHRWKDGTARRKCRDCRENSNARAAQDAPGSEFIAAIGPAAVETFSAKMPRGAGGCTRNRYAGLNPNVRSKRLA